VNPRWNIKQQVWGAPVEDCHHRFSDLESGGDQQDEPAPAIKPKLPLRATNGDVL
jgi:hypothetical protein